RRQMVTVNRAQEKQGAHPAVEVLFVATKSVEFVAGGEQFGGGFTCAPLFQGAVAHLRFRRGDEVEQRRFHDWPLEGWASSSTICVSTMSRSRPARESASCASKSP